MVLSKNLYILLLFFCLFVKSLYPADIQDINLNEIADKIDSYRGKTVNIVLRLKNFDRKNKIITFYDKENHDIHFDVKKQYKDKKCCNFKKLHNGMLYLIKFKVIKIENNKMVFGELIKFYPYVLDKIP